MKGFVIGHPPTAKEHVNVNSRWGTVDPTVLGTGPLRFYTISQLIKNDSAKHYWTIVLSTAELYER